MNKIVSTWREYYVFWAYIIFALQIILFMLDFDWLNNNGVIFIECFLMSLFVISYPIIGLIYTLGIMHNKVVTIAYLLFIFPWLFYAVNLFFYFTIPVMD
jgi:hypothetical protein